MTGKTKHAGRRGHICGAIIVGAQFFLTAPSFAEPAFLRLEDVSGESKDTDHLGWIMISSWEWNEQGRGAAASSGGGARRESTSLTVTKTVDRSSVALTKATETRQHFASAVLESGCVNGRYFTIDMQDVFVSGFNRSGAQNGERPEERITLAFAKETSGEKACQSGDRAILPPLTRQGGALIR
jgi:type VI secretion system secreted protein Hcp